MKQVTIEAVIINWEFHKEIEIDSSRPGLEELHLKLKALTK